MSELRINEQQRAAMVADSPLTRDQLDRMDPEALAGVWEMFIAAHPEAVALEGGSRGMPMPRINWGAPEYAEDVESGDDGTMPMPIVKW